jgi:hypothetical protein
MRYTNANNGVSVLANLGERSPAEQKTMSKRFFLSETEWNNNRPAGATAPQTDFDKSDLNHHNGGDPFTMGDLGLGDGIKGYVALADLPPGAIETAPNGSFESFYDGVEDWRALFDRNDVYPPIKVELSAGQLYVLDGNHRRIIWEEWGYTHAPAFMVWTGSVGAQEAGS